MIEIIYKNNKFLVKGTFEFGFIGTYENKNFEDSNSDNSEISIYDNIEDILEDIKNENSNYYKILKDYIVGNKIDGDTIAKVLTQYYNKREKEVKENENLIKNNVLINLFRFFNNVGYEFWKIKDFTIEEELQKFISINKKFVDCEDCDENEDCEYYEDCIYSLVYENSDIINEWTIQDVKNGKLDVEKSLKSLFPMINFEFLLNSVNPINLALDGKFISFEFYNKFENAIFYPYDKIDEEFNFLDWHFDCDDDFEEMN